MPGTTLCSSASSHALLTGFLAAGLSLGLVSCRAQLAPVSPRSLHIHQTWQLQPGSQVAGRRISGGLGDISVELAGASVYAPFNGHVQSVQGIAAPCVVLSSPEVPAYLLRLCGVRQPKLGDVLSGQPIGSAETLQFAALRKQPDGKWALVEPSVQILAQTLTPP